MIGNNIGIWLIIGLIPYYISKQQTKNGWIVQVHALFWSLEMQYELPGRNRWTLRIPLIGRLRSACWAIIAQLREENIPKK